jgi:glycosyltransferase involved in cell wall biosynthesis
MSFATDRLVFRAVMAKRLRILQVNTESAWRGGERQTLLTMLALRDLGHELELLCARSSVLGDRAQAQGFVVYRADTGLGYLSWLARHGHRYQLVHAQTAKAVTWAVIAKFVFRRPVVFTKRTSFPLRAGQWQTRLKWQRVSQMVAISEAAASAPRQFAIDTLVIPSAVPTITPDPGRVNAFLVKHKLHGKRLVGTASALSPEKDPITLINAAAQVCRLNSDVVFVHWGAPERAAQAAQEHIQALGLQGRYLLLGFEQAVEQLYPALSVFVMASRFEALGSSVLDAMLQKIPVVSTDAGGLKETLANGRGLISPVGDAHAMALQILSVLDRPKFWVSMVERAYQDIQSEYSVQKMAKRYQSIYKKLT